jgi:hypothetical protein
MTPGNEGDPPEEGRPEAEPLPRRSGAVYAEPPIPAQRPSWTDNASAFGAMMNRPLTTTRRCAGAYCWCRVGAAVVWPLDRLDEMRRMARAIRRIEVAEGVLGA